MVWLTINIKVWRVIAQVENICGNCWLVVQEVAEEVGIFIGSSHTISTEDLGIYRVSAKFVPRLLTIRNCSDLASVNISKCHYRWWDVVLQLSFSFSYQFCLSAECVYRYTGCQKFITHLNRSAIIRYCTFSLPAPFPLSASVHIWVYFVLSVIYILVQWLVHILVTVLKY
jgi:hypothetical protein